MTNEEFTKELEKKTAAILKHFLEEKLPQRIERALTNSARTILGFETDSWGDSWRVDHCNGREPAISNLLKAQVTAALEHISQKYGDQLFVFDLPPPAIEALKKTAYDHLCYKLERLVEATVEKRAQELADSVVDSAIKQYQSNLKEGSTTDAKSL